MTPSSSRASRPTARRGARRAAASPRPDGALVERLLRSAATIRAAELRILKHIEEAGFSGLWHPGIGQEGIHSGAAEPLATEDYLFYSHRGTGGPIAKGLALEKLFGDLLTRVCGTTRGKGGGTPHFSDPAIGLLGFGGTLGSVFVMAAGTALASRIRGDGRVTIGIFGEGAAARGPFHECALEAATRRLPVVWLCENNGWALSAPFDAISLTDIADRAVAYGMPGVVVDGQDALAVRAAVATAVERARAGEGPSLIEAKTLRLRGHYEGDQQKYRTDDAPGTGGPDDPLVRLRAHLPEDRAAALEREAQEQVEAAFETALASPRPDPSIVFEDVFA